MYSVANTSEDGTSTMMPEEEVKEQKAITKKALKKEIIAMAVLKQTYKKTYGNLQISLKIHIFWEKIFTQTPSWTCYEF